LGFTYSLVSLPFVCGFYGFLVPSCLSGFWHCFILWFLWEPLQLRSHWFAGDCIKFFIPFLVFCWFCWSWYASFFLFFHVPLFEWLLTFIGTVILWRPLQLRGHWFARGYISFLPFRKKETLFDALFLLFHTALESWFVFCTLNLCCFFFLSDTSLASTDSSVVMLSWFIGPLMATKWKWPPQQTKQCNFWTKVGEKRNYKIEIRPCRNPTSDLQPSAPPTELRSVIKASLINISDGI